MKYLVLIAAVLFTQQSYSSTVEIQKYLEASNEFEVLMRLESANGDLPRIESKETSKIIKKLSKTQSALISKKYSVNQMGGLIEACGKAGQFGMSYITHNMQSVVKETDSPQVGQTKMMNLMNENSIKYQNELNVFYPFMVDCLAKQSSLITPFWESLPADQRTDIRKGGVVQMRRGILKIYAGVLISLGDKNLKVSFKDSLLTSASNAASVMAPLLTLKNRDAILKMLHQHSQTASKNYLEHFKIITNAFSSKDCGVICQL